MGSLQTSFVSCKKGMVNMMNQINRAMTGFKERPIKVLQFGEGNFLRGFVDYMIDIANEKGVFDGNIVIVKPIEYGSLEAFHEQECQYTLSLRGKEEGKVKEINRVITSVAGAVDCITEYEKYADYAKCDTLRFIVSNTTEAGIVFDEKDLMEYKPPITYPGKLTKFLYDRFEYVNGDENKGLIMLPVELIDDNGKELKRCVYEYAKLWNLGDAFISWLDKACVFGATLVDRIITGYPKEEAKGMCERFGYLDKLIDTGELFALWVIETDREIKNEFPLDQAGLPVIFTKNHKPYKERKVRILNGAHTSFVLASYLAGNDYVGESMKDPMVLDFMKATVFEEIIPTLSLPTNDCVIFANAVIERFENPFIKHSLLAISLNSVSKWKARCMPSLLGYVKKFNEIPKHLCFSLAALIQFYSSDNLQKDHLVGLRNGEEYKIVDEEKVLTFFAENSKLREEELVPMFLSHEDFFGQNLCKVENLETKTIEYLRKIRKEGIREAMHFL